MENPLPSYADHLAPVWARYFDLVVDDAQGCEVWATATARALAQVRPLFKSQTSPDDTAALLIEPVLGVGGVFAPAEIVLPEPFFAAARGITTRVVCSTPPAE